MVWLHISCTPPGGRKNAIDAPTVMTKPASTLRTVC